MMAYFTKNKLSAKLIKAEMLNDQATVAILKAELAKLPTSPAGEKPVSSQRDISKTRIHIDNKEQLREQASHKIPNHRVKKFVQSNNSLSQMFAPETHLTSSDEARMYLKTSSKFSKEDMETKYFSEEVDDSQVVLDKRQKLGPKPGGSAINRSEVNQQSCSRCFDRRSKHLIVDSASSCIYMTLMSIKPLFSTVSNVIIVNNDHLCSSFVAATQEHQVNVGALISRLQEAWNSKGYTCVIMETYLRDWRPTSREFISCSDHFQIHCIPIREKYLEKTRMCYKQALQAIGSDWSMNRKLINTDGKRIQKCLPKSLSYFWVCFDDLRSGFGHVIESDKEFSRYFGFEVLSGAIGKEFNQMKLSESESFNEQFDRSREFKLLFSNFQQPK